ncbi:MAG: hypothetical protein HGB10_11150 [Coriobacteriia bacterium]|nr:hypothetical protein [Coriobacteriia bacterium]
MGRALLAIPLAMAILFGASVAPAHAIDRKTVLKRANRWVSKRVMYSQSRKYGGYRRDCSGFVSMSWKLKRSYTSSSIRSQAKRIKTSKLKPGDMIRRPGHVEIFGGWKNKKKRTYVSYEESSWGKPALRHVQKLHRGSTAWRYKRIKDKPRSARKPTPKPVTPPVTPEVPVIPPVVDPSLEPTGSLTPSASVEATLLPAPFAALLP